MFFANPWGLLGLLALPIIAGIHLFQRRFPQLDVAGLHLWDRELKTKKSGRRVNRLPISRTLLLELLCGLLLTLLLAQPRVSTTGNIQRWIVVLDNSASMSAVLPNDKSLAEVAIRTIEEQIGEKSSAQITVLLTGRRPTILAGPRVSWTEAKSQLTKWSPQDVKHDFQVAWDMAAELADHDDNLLFVTDQMVADESQLPTQMTIAAIGDSLSNLCFESARWSPPTAGESARLYVRISNQSDQDIQADLIGRSAGTEIFRQSINMKKNAATPFESELPNSLPNLELLLDSPLDSLKKDSQVMLVRPEDRTVSYQVELPSEHPAQRSIQKVMDLIEHTVPARETVPHLIIGDINQPVVKEGTRAWFGIGPLVAEAPPTSESNEVETTTNPDSEPESGPGPQINEATEREDSESETDQSDNDHSSDEEKAAVQPRSSIGPFLMDRRDSVLEGVTLDGVFWGGIFPLEENSSPLISAGGMTLLGRRVDMDRSWYFVNIDLARSNLLTSADWPILISNIVEETRQNLPGLRNWNYKIGEQIEFRLSRAQYEKDVSRPLKLRYSRGDNSKGERTIARLPKVEIPSINETGVYEILDGNDSIDSFAVNFFDSDESDLRSLNTGFRKGVSQSIGEQPHEHNLTWLWWLLMGVAGLAIVLDWLVLRPRRS